MGPLFPKGRERIVIDSGQRSDSKLVPKNPLGQMARPAATIRGGCQCDLSNDTLTSMEMTRAGGRPSRRMIDHEFPHQVMVSAEDVGGKKPDFVVVFHAQIDQRAARSVDVRERKFV
jgi:hypothetical protein